MAIDTPTRKKPAKPAQEKVARPIQTFRQLKRTGREKEFLQDMDAFAEAQRDLIEAEVSGFVLDPVAQAARVQLAFEDFRYFGKTYLPHYIKGDESVFHTWFYDNVPQAIDGPEGRLLDISAPRGEAKSTLGTQALVLWCIVTKRKHFIGIVMDAWDQAATMLEAVKSELTDNPRLRADFPEATGKGRVWNAGVILTANNIKVQAFGSGKKMRGLRHGPHRPDLIMLDDIENDENVRQLTQRDKLESWVLKTVLNLGPPDGSMDVVYLNTILHHDSVANRFHKKPRWIRRKFKAIIEWPDRMDLWDEWEAMFLAEASGDESEEGETPVIGQAKAFYLANKEEMDRGAVVSWPTVRPLLRLMELRAEDHHAFDCEYQNDPRNADDAFFPDFTYYIQPSRDWVHYGSDDPSLGRFNISKRDPCAILVGAYDRLSGKLCVIEAIVRKMKPAQQINQIIDFQREYECIAWAIEAIQFQEFFREILVEKSAAAHMHVPALPVHPHTDKALRIESLSPHVMNGVIQFNRKHTTLLEQLKHYPEADHDDGPDSLEMLWKLAKSGAGSIPRIRTGKRRN